MSYEIKRKEITTARKPNYVKRNAGIREGSTAVKRVVWDLYRDGEFFRGYDRKKDAEGAKDYWEARDAREA